MAKNEDFVAFANGVAQRLLDEPEADLESERTEQIAKIGENIRISRSQALEPKDNGLVESYVHTGAKVAVLLSMGTGSSSASADSKVLSLAKDMCMHIAATSPVCVSRDEVPADLVEKEKDIAMAQAEGKPPQAIEKIIQGKLEKYFANACFLEQPFVKDPDQTIKQLLHAASQEVGSELSVESFIRFQVGEDS